MNAGHSLLFSLFLLVGVGQAADFGTWGDLYPVREESMLQLITRRLAALQQSGELGQWMQDFQKRAVVHSERPAPVPGIGRVEKITTRRFSPAVTLSTDIRDNEGRLIAVKGQVFNPLAFVPFRETLYFINADDPEQLAWMKRQVPQTPMVKIILVQGNIPETSQTLNSRIYFDQGGALCQRFGLTRVPVRITSAPGNTLLNIDEIPPGTGAE
jgi:conjugal transfer pilus assembly protein TraW